MARTLTLYTKDGCGYCTRLKRYLRTARVPFTERNISEDLDARRFWEARHSTVPQAYVDDDLFQEGGAEGIESLSPEKLKEKLIRFGLVDPVVVDKPCDTE